MPKGFRRCFDCCYKIQAVSLIVENGRRLSDVASDLGIHPSTLNRWKHELAGNTEPEKFTPSK